MIVIFVLIVDIHNNMNLNVDIDVELYISVLLGISYNFPNGDRVMIGDCLNKCPQRVRCMGKPTLRNLAANCKDRGFAKFSVTELIRGTREMFLLKNMDYDVEPQSMLFAAHGTAIHKINEENSWE